MKMVKKLISSSLALITYWGCINCGYDAVSKVNASPMYTYTYECDINNDGVTNMADSVLLIQYLLGVYDVVNPDMADFDNDGLVTEVDKYKLQRFLLQLPVSINHDDTTGSSTVLNNTTKQYKKYNASTGVLLGTYTVNALTTIDESSNRSIIGDYDERDPDYSHTGICKITKTDGSSDTGFVVSNNGILTAGHVVNGKKISSITFYDNNGVVEYTTTAVDYSVPSDYASSSPTDYALITVNSDLSVYNVFGRGYALDRAISEEANVYVTGFSGDLSYESTGPGKLKNSTSGFNELKHSCDTNPGASGSPIYADLVYNGIHYYVVIGIHTSGKDSGVIHHLYNSGVRMCPNIWNLVRSNL